MNCSGEDRADSHRYRDDIFELLLRRGGTGVNRVESYYRILGVSPTASATELEAAIDASYQENLRKVIAHNRDTADDANRMLRLLEEQIRPTLTDPARRATYDARLAVSEQIGGLADPDAQQGVSILPPRPEQSIRSIPQSGASVVDAWVCPKCQAQSPRGTRFCGTCSYKIGIECPKCGKLVFANVVFCSECSVEVKPELALKTAREEAQKAEQAHMQLTALQAQLQTARAKVDELEPLVASWQSWLSSRSSAKRQYPGCVPSIVGAVVVMSGIAIGYLVVILLYLGLGKGSPLIPILIGGVLGLSVIFFGNAIGSWYFGRPVYGRQIEQHRQQIAQIEKQIAQLQAQPARSE